MSVVADSSGTAVRSSRFRCLSQSESNPAEPALMVEASSRVLEAACLLDGSALLRCSDENLEAFADLCPQQLGPEAAVLMPSVTLTWASACSGTEGAFYVAEAMSRSFHKAKMPIHLKHQFSCEQNKDKQKWVHCVLACGPVLGSTDSLEKSCLSQDQPEDAEEDDAAHHACIFADIQTLGQHEAHCVVHNRKCRVPEVDIFICGVSCKDVSRQNPNRSQTKLVMAEKESRGGTSQTWHGFVAFVSTCQPGIVVFENVDGVDDNVGAAAQSNMDLVLQQMDDLGYASQPMMTEASEFGCPARRRRLYICFIKKSFCKFSFQERTMATTKSMFRTMVACCVRSPPCVSEVLLDSADPAVAAGLQEVQARKARAEERADQAKSKAPAQALASTAQSKVRSSSSKASGGWVEQHLRVSEALGVRWGAPVPREYEINEWFLTFTDREKDALLIARSQVKSQSADTEVVFFNVSQSVMCVHTASFNKDTGKHLAPTMLPSQVLFMELVKPARLLLGREALIMQAFPVKLFLQAFEEYGFEPSKHPLPDVSAGTSKRKRQRTTDKPWLTEAFMTDLAGNAMSLPVLLAVLQSVVCALDLRSVEGGGIMEQDTEAALEALQLLS